MLMTLDDNDLLQTGAFIDGRFVAAISGETYPVYNPANGDAAARVANCGVDEARLAIEAAAGAFGGWQALPGKARSAFLEAWHDAILAHRDDLARILTTEQGKPLAEAESEILYGASYIRWFAEEAKRICGDYLPPVSRDARLFCIKQPIGVVACITPWNFPNAMLARKIAPALAAGCTVVCKPANETPLSANAMAELARRVGIPAGVINIVSGKTVEIGRELTAAPIVRKLSFTGSTATGKLLASQCTGTLKRTSMELGGNAPFIVFESADLDAAVRGLVANKFRNAGQTCVCANRVLVQRPILATFLEKLIEAVAAINVTDPSDPAATMGPLISNAAVRKVEELIADARHKGANVIAPNQQHVDGNFMTPKIICDATPNMRMFSEEIFGPVVPIFTFETEEEALDLSNASPFGLAAYFYSQDLSQIFRVGDGLEAGMVGVNDAALSNETIPFGGVKESGQGREGSKYGLDDYLEIKHIKLGGLS